MAIRRSNQNASGKQKRQTRVLQRGLEAGGETKKTARTRAATKVKNATGGRKGGGGRAVSLKATRGTPKTGTKKTRK